MGNEFGHPEWIDFPRAGNNWSYQYARRQWSLVDNTELKYHYLANFDKAMLRLMEEYKILNKQEITLLHENKPDQVVAFKRGELIFIFNFNPDRSFQDYAFQTDAGKYNILLSTDSIPFGGNGLVNEEMIYYTNYNEDKIMRNNNLKIYIPSRTGLIFKRIPSKSVYDL
jgi:1,4-alpha-glucan branching enzyme